MHIINRDVHRAGRWRRILVRVTPYLQDELDDMAGIRRGQQEPDLASSQFFWRTKHYSHQRPHYFASVRMFSSQNYSMEVSFDGEGLKNHHLAVGYIFITRTGEDYVDVFPAWDWQRIPGTTVVIPDPTAVRLDNRRRSGAWEINSQTWFAGAGEVQKDVFTRWIDHGLAWQQAGYEYIVVPGIEAAAVDRRRENVPVKILANTSKLQAVRHRGLCLSQIVFSERGETVIADGITACSGTPGLMMIKTAGREVEEIAVSDPSRQLGSIRLEVTSRLEAEGDRWEATWNEEERYGTVHFDLPEGEYAGRSFSVEFP